MLHHKALVRLFHRFGEQCAFDVASIDKIAFVAAVSAGNHRFSDKALYREIFCLCADRKKRRRNIAPVDMIDQIFFIGVAGGMHLGLSVADKLKRDIRMGQGKALYQVTDIISLRLRGF